MMDELLKIVFLILAVLFAILLPTLWSGYRMRQKANKESRERQNRELFAAVPERRGRRRGPSEDHTGGDDYEGCEEEKDDDSLEAIRRRLQRIRNSLQFETLTLPSPTSKSGRERKMSHDVESNIKVYDDDPTEAESCHCGEENQHINNTDVQNVASSSAPQNMKRLSSSSLPPLGDSSGVTSILGCLMSPWWGTSENGENVCCICLEAYQPDEMICSPKCSDCNHIFHEHCAIPWFREHDECPMCRTNIILASIPAVVNGHDDANETSSPPLALR